MSENHSDALVLSKRRIPAKQLEFCIKFIYPVIPDRAVLD